MTNTQTPDTAATLTTFVYIAEGEPHVGTVLDYAEALQAAHYCGLDVSHTVWTFADGRWSSLHARIHMNDYDENDYAYVTVELPFTAPDDPEVATFRLDGRS